MRILKISKVNTLLVGLLVISVVSTLAILLFGVEIAKAAGVATEKAYFPMQYLNITQGVNGELSHQGSNAIDCAGKDAGIDNVVAPFTGTIKKIYGTGIWIESNNMVEYADGTIDYLTVMIHHDNDVSDLQVGQVIPQGTVFYQEGTYGIAYGNHIHLECGKGKFSGTGWSETGFSYEGIKTYKINNSMNPYDALYLQSSTIVINGYGYNWKTASVNTLQSISITTPATKLSYTVGDTLDISGLVVTGTYSDGRTKAEGITAANITGFNSAVAATDQVLTITVGGKTTTYKVQIAAAIVNPDYTYTVTAGNAQITGYTGAGGAVTIPSTLGGAPVTSIGNSAFYSCKGLTSISIPQGVTSIGDSAFVDCTGLTTISLPQGVTSIGHHVFWSCTGLTSISLPQTVTKIGEYAFACTGLTSISLPQGVTSISNYAFVQCTGLMSISLPQTVTSIGDNAFNQCTGLTSISLPQTVTSIGLGAFSSCTGLTSISIPQGVTSIGEAAFEECKGLTSIIIPRGVTSIGDYAFASCTRLTSITVAVDNLNYASIDGVLFNKAGTILIACPGSLTSISIPQGVTSIGNYAFWGCTGLTTISIPQGVASIGDLPFYDCAGLTSITFNSATTAIAPSWHTIPTATKIIGYDPSTAKTYATNNGRTFEVIGATNTLQSIAIMTPATKLSYTVGDPLDITGLVVTESYSDGSTTAASITAANVTGFNSANAVVDQVLTITVGDKTTTYKVQITPDNMTGTPVVQIGVNPNDSDSAGIFIGLGNIKDSSGNTIANPNVAGYQIEVDYDPTKVAILDVVDETNSGQITKTIDSGKVTVTGSSTNGAISFNKLFFIPITLKGSALDTASLQVKYLSVSDANHIQINVVNPSALVFQRGKILNEASGTQPNISDTVAGLQYLAGLKDAGTDLGQVNPINMASIVGQDVGSTVIKSSVKDIIALMQYLVNIRDPYFIVSSSGGGGGGVIAPPDKTLLTTAIGNATTLIGSKTVGAEVGDVSQAAHDAFQASIVVATAVKNDAGATQAQVYAQVTALGSATIAFNNASII